jgi:hypothetical protein
MLPALPVTLFPGSVFVGGNTMPVREWCFAGFKKPQFVEKMTHRFTPGAGRCACVCHDLVCLTSEHYKNVGRMMIDLAQACYGSKTAKLACSYPQRGRWIFR